MPKRTAAGWLLGFALGGFFDGILLHQILQWHHVLLGLRRAPFDELRVQIFADGVFHLLMYAIALAGLWSLARARAAGTTPPTRRLVGELLLGFGTWHVVDAVLAHWLLGLHRIRMDVPDPLLWDVAWLLVFGIVPVVLGWWLRRRPPPSARTRAGRIAQSVVGVLVLLAATLAALPPRGIDTVAVLVRPQDASRLLDGLAGVRGGIVWFDRSAALWIVRLPPAAEARDLYAHGALLISRSPALLGCLAAAR